LLDLELVEDRKQLGRIQAARMVRVGLGVTGHAVPADDETGRYRQCPTVVAIDELVIVLERIPAKIEEVLRRLRRDYDEARSRFSISGSAFRSV